MVLVVRVWGLGLSTPLEFKVSGSVRPNTWNVEVAGTLQLFLPSKFCGKVMLMFQVCGSSVALKAFEPGKATRCNYNSNKKARLSQGYRPLHTCISRDLAFIKPQTLNPSLRMVHDVVIYPRYCLQKHSSPEFNAQNQSKAPDPSPQTLNPEPETLLRKTRK